MSFTEEDPSSMQYHSGHVFLSSPHSGFHHSSSVLSPMTRGTLPRSFPHSSPLRSIPDWVASPVRMPDWTQDHSRPFPPDYGLPVRYRPEVHLANNPLDTLREEESFPGSQYSTSAIQALELLNQV